MTTPARLAEIAGEIERRRKGTLPKSVHADGGKLWCAVCVYSIDAAVIHDDAAEQMLIGAMVMATGADRTAIGWRVVVVDKVQAALDVLHGGPLESLFALFCAAFPEVADGGA